MVVQGEENLGDVLEPLNMIMNWEELTPYKEDKVMYWI